MRQTLDITRAISDETISEQAIREQLSHILRSPMFAQSERLRRFLSFTVEATLAGEGNGLNEYLIGTEVYDRKPFSSSIWTHGWSLPWDWPGRSVLLALVPCGCIMGGKQLSARRTSDG